MVRIAVEHPFTDVRRALENKGYQADMIDQKTDAVSYDVVIVRDQEDFADFRMSASLIEARGRTVNEIVEEVEERLQRAGKIPGGAPKAPASTQGGSFLAGLATGAAAGAVAAMLLTPKSGKEMKEMVKDKMPTGGGQSQSDSSQSGGTMSQMKEKATDIAGKVKDKMPTGGSKSDSDSSQGGGTMSQMKEKATGAVKQVKDKMPMGGVVDKVQGKAVEMKEKQELTKAQKEVAKEVKEEEQARSAHEKAEKHAEKEMKKADKEAKKEGNGNGGMKVVELTDAVVDQRDDSGEVIIQKGDDTDNKNK